MTLARKGTRKLVVAGVAYRWHVSRWRKISDWTPARAGLIDEAWLSRARKLGLGGVADVTFTIAVELEEKPRSKIIATYHASIVDGFLGPEQLTRIQPKLASAIVEHALASGWKPAEVGDFRMNIVETGDEPKRPALLVLPGVIDHADGYEPRIVALKIR